MGEIKYPCATAFSQPASSFFLVQWDLLKCLCISTHSNVSTWPLSLATLLSVAYKFSHRTHISTQTEIHTKRSTHNLNYHAFPISPLLTSHLYSVKSHCYCIYSLAKRLFWRLTGRAEPVNSQTCRVRSNNKDLDPSEQRDSQSPRPSVAWTHTLLI